MTTHLNLGNFAFDVTYRTGRNVETHVYLLKRYVPVTPDNSWSVGINCNHGASTGTWTWRGTRHDSARRVVGLK